MSKAVRFIASVALDGEGTTTFHGPASKKKIDEFLWQVRQAAIKVQRNVVTEVHCVYALDLPWSVPAARWPESGELSEGSRVVVTFGDLGEVFATLTGEHAMVDGRRCVRYRTDGDTRLWWTYADDVTPINGAPADASHGTD
jgi:hypothetical protein